VTIWHYSQKQYSSSLCTFYENLCRHNNISGKRSFTFENNFPTTCIRYANARGSKYYMRHFTLILVYSFNKFLSDTLHVDTQAVSICHPPLPPNQTLNTGLLFSGASMLLRINFPNKICMDIFSIYIIKQNLRVLYCLSLTSLSTQQRPRALYCYC
jgi:hypothetical protein